MLVSYHEGSVWSEQGGIASFGSFWGCYADVWIKTGQRAKGRDILQRWLPKYSKNIVIAWKQTYMEKKLAPASRTACFKRDASHGHISESGSVSAIVSARDQLPPNLHTWMFLWEYVYKHDYLEDFFLCGLKNCRRTYCFVLCFRLTPKTSSWTSPSADPQLSPFPFRQDRDLFVKHCL